MVVLLGTARKYLAVMLWGELMLLVFRFENEAERLYSFTVIWVEQGSDTE